METRACPSLREAGCPDLPCARFEETDEDIIENVWAPEIARMQKALMERHGA